MGATIVDVASALGSRTVTDDDLLAEHPEWNLERVKRATGVSVRHAAAPDESTQTLARDACEALLARHRDLAGSLDLLIVVTQTPDQQIPSTACILHGELGLGEQVGAFDLGAACSGFVYGLAVADGLMAAHRAQRAILVTSETYTRLLEPDDRSTRALFSDAATATLIERGNEDVGVLDVAWGSRGAAADRLHTPAAADGRPRLAMDGRAVLAFTFEVIPDQLQRLLASHGLTTDDVDLFVLHQASALVLTSIEEQLALRPDQVPRSLDRHGNTVSSSIPLTLERLLADGQLAGSLTVLSGFGAGLSWASALVRW